jgi:hypothetical protein
MNQKTIYITISIVMVLLITAAVFFINNKNNQKNSVSSIDEYSETELEKKLGDPEKLNKQKIEKSNQNKKAMDQETNQEKTQKIDEKIEINQNIDENSEDGNNKNNQILEENSKSEEEPVSARIVMPLTEEEEKNNKSIQTLIAEKIKKDTENVNIVIDFESDGYGKGIYSFENEAGGGEWLAKKNDNQWEILWYGDSQDFCDNTKSYSLPEEMIWECNLK